jgi:branched-chain amino acid transport system permease protein
MLRLRFQQFLDSLRQGINSGFVTGLIVMFLILIGVPINLRSVALFSLLMVTLIFGVQLARRLREASLAYLLRNAVAMGLVAAVMTLLLLGLINGWQAKGIDVKQYFEAVNLETMTVLSGVPAEELHANPSKDPFTGQYPPDKPLRTDPMRLTFDSDTGLVLRVGPWIDLNLVVGGLYGFLLLLIVAGVLGAVIMRGVIEADLARYRHELAKNLAGNPVAHWVVLSLPLILFALLWLTAGQGKIDPLISLETGRRELQLGLGFLIILGGLIALRTAQPVEWGLDYQVRLAVCLGTFAVVALLGLEHVIDDHVYFIATGWQPGGNAELSVAAILIVSALLAVQAVLALRIPENLETQFAAISSLGIVMILPLYMDQGQNQTMILVGIYILLGVGLNIVVGYAGLLDLGYVAFFALGAYTYAFLSSNQRELDSGNLKFGGNDEMVVTLTTWTFITLIVATLVIYAGLYFWRERRRAAPNPPTSSSSEPSHHMLLDLPARPTTGVTILLTVLAVVCSVIVALIMDATGFSDVLFGAASPFLIGLLAGVIVAALAGILLGIPVLRLRGDYLAIVTLGFGEIIRILFNNLRDYTGGPQGVLQIPRPIPGDASGPATYLTLMYLVLLGMGLVAFFSMRLRHSRTGRAWSAMSSDEDIAQSMGVNLVQSKLMAFAFGAAFAGIGGVLFAARQQNIFPKDFNLDVSIEVLSLVIIGGMGSIPGVIMGAIVLIGIPETLRDLKSYRILVFGALLVAMVIIRPKGLLPEPEAQLQDRAKELSRKRKEEGVRLVGVAAPPPREVELLPAGAEEMAETARGKRARGVFAWSVLSGTIGLSAGLLWFQQYADKVKAFFSPKSRKSRK